MGILKSELCKLLSKRTVWILLLLIAVNPLLQLYTIKTPNDDLYTLEDYSALYREIGSVDPEEIPAVLEKKENSAATFWEAGLVRRVSGEVSACLAYRDYLDSIEERVDEIAIMRKFVNDDGYALKNAEKTSEVYKKLKGVEPEVQDPMPLLNVTDNKLTDYLAIIMIFIISLNLVFYEKNENQLSLLRTAPDGRRKLMAAKVAAMFLAVLAVLVSLYAVNVLVGRCVFGTMDFGSPIQSIYVYRQSPFRLSIGGYLLAWFAAKTLTCFLLGVFFMLMGAVFNNIIFVFVSSVVTVLAEILLFTKISSTHFLAFLKYNNITYGIETGRMFSDYVNLKLFGSPGNTLIMYWILWSIVTAVLIFFVVNYLESVHETKAASSGWRSLRGGSECHTSVFRHESFKMLFPGKCLIILALFCLFTIRWNPATRVQFDSVDEVYYKDYMDRFYGPLDDEKREMIRAEQTKFDRLIEDMNADYEQGKSIFYIENKYRDDLNRQNAFGLVRRHAEYLESVDGGWLFFDKGYRILTDTKDFLNRDIMQAFVFVTVLIAMTFGIFGLDHRNSEVRILRTTYLGRRKLSSVKCILGVLCVLAAFSLVYIVHAVNVLRAYGTGGMDAPAASIENLSRIPQNISVSGYLLIIMLMRLAGGLLAVAVVAFLFRRLKNGIAVIIACVVIFLIPLVMVALKIPNAQYILLNPLLLGNVF